MIQAMFTSCQITFRACRRINVPDIVWEQDWLMSFNSEKCEILRVHRKRNTFLFTYTHYTI